MCCGVGRRSQRCQHYCSICCRAVLNCFCAFFTLFYAGVITASIIAVAVLVALIVLAVYLVMKKRQDRLNDVHSALQLTSRSVKAPDEDDGDGNHERTSYDSFQTDADIIID